MLEKLKSYWPILLAPIGIALFLLSGTDGNTNTFNAITYIGLVISIVGIGWIPLNLLFKALFNPKQ